MKAKNLLGTAFLIILLMGSSASAYNPTHLNRLLQTKQCSSCDLTFADFRGKDLSGADLSFSDLRGANLYRANLNGANLQGAKLSGATMPDGNVHP
ncbi:MAG: hypothetical protein DCF22_15530 [Leptolyngbya sp.]|nr:MAG: hypothetical protein DCF22_15530 [Leptolyngbya sp.]